MSNPPPDKIAGHTFKPIRTGAIVLICVGVLTGSVYHIGKNARWWGSPRSMTMPSKPPTAEQQARISEIQAQILKARTQAEAQMHRAMAPPPDPAEILKHVASTPLPPAPAARPKPRAISDVPRVALVNFSSDDNLYHSLSPCADLTALLQARLADAPGLQWVERDQLHLAQDELRVSSFSIGTDAAAALHLGRMVKADLMVRGRFLTRPQHARVLRLEVIDMYRADVLESLELPFEGDARDPVQVSGGAAEGIASKLKLLLAGARQRLTNDGDQRHIATLFFRNTSSTPRLNFLEADLHKGLEEAAHATKGIRVLRFPRTTEAFAEAEMAVLGLTEVEPEAWQQIADIYAWGSYKEKDGDNKSFDDIEVEISIDVWDGRSQVRSLQRTTKVRELGTGIAELSKAVCDSAAQMPPGLPSFELRDQVAEALTRRAEEVGQSIVRYHADPTSAWGRSLRHHQMRLIDTAAFFSPQSEPVRHTLLQAQWGTQGTYTQDLDVIFRQMRDFERYLLSFGARTDLAFPTDMMQRYVGAVSTFIIESWRHGFLDYRPNGLFPMGMPDSARAAWEREVVGRFATVIKTIAPRMREEKRVDIVYGQMLLDYAGRYMSDPQAAMELVDVVWPISRSAYRSGLANGRYREQTGETYRNLYRIYQAAGQPERLIKLLREEEEAVTSPEIDNRAAILRPDRDFVAERRAALMRQAASPRTFLARRSPPTVVVAPAAPSSLPPAAPSKAIPAIHPVMRPLRWERRDEWTTNPRIYQPPPPMVLGSGAALPNPIASMVRVGDRVCVATGDRNLYVYDPAGDAFVSLTQRLGLHTTVNAMAVRNEELWLATDGDSAWRIDTRDLSGRQFTGKDGVLTPRLYTVAVANERVYFGGEASRLSVFDPGSNRWADVAPKDDRPTQSIRKMIGFSRWLLLPGEQWRLIDLRDGSSQTIHEALARGFGVNSDNPNLKTLPESQRQTLRWNLAAASADESGFWLVTGFSLVHFDPTAAKPERWECPLENIDNILPDGDLIWVAGLNEQKPAAGPPPGPMDPHGFPGQRLGFPFGPGGIPGDFDPRGTRTPEPESSWVALWHRPTQKWIGSWTIQGKVTHLAATSRSLWLARPGLDPLVEVDKRSCLATIGAGLSIVTAREESDTDLNKPDRYGATPLMRAAYSGSLDDVKKLIGLGADVNVEGELARTALRAAVQAGHIEIVRALLEKNANVEPRQSGPQRIPTPTFVLAIDNRRPDIAELLLAHGASIDVAGNDGRTALHRALADRRLESVRWLIEHKADVNRPDGAGQSPLLIAVAQGEMEIVRMLLAAHADVGGTIGAAAMTIALHSGKTALVSELLVHGADPNLVGADRAGALSMAILAGDNTILKDLLEHKADPNRVDLDGTPLTRAVEKDNAQAVGLLLEHGADPHRLWVHRVTMSRDPYVYYESALGIAARSGNMQMMDLLLRSGMKPGNSTVGATFADLAFMDASREGQILAMEKLLDLGAHVNAHDPEGLTPLMWAARQQSAAAVQLLLARGADPALRANDGRTAAAFIEAYIWNREMCEPIKKMLARSAPGRMGSQKVVLPRNPWLRGYELAHAAQEGPVEAFLGMLDAGADPNTSSPEGWPLVALAARGGQVEIVGALLSRGADINAAGPGGWTALMQAVARSKPRVVDLLLRKGADPHRINDWGRSAYHLAEQYGYGEVLAAFKSQDIRRSTTPVAVDAVRIGALHLLEVLLENGETTDASDSDGRTVLHHAVVIRAANDTVPQLVKFLLEHGAPVNKPDMSGQTPLIAAVASDQDFLHPQTIELLLQAGADPAAKDKIGQTALDGAGKIRDVEKRRAIEEMLRVRGAARKN